MIVERDADMILHAGAVFSACRRYRYLLWRVWDERAPYVVFAMLNPSTADAFRFDPTVRRCYGYAHRWGFGGLVVVNVFALRSTDPRALYVERDPIGAANDLAIRWAAAGAGLVVCAWGNHARLHRRADAVRALLRDVAPLHALKLNAATGEPAHPLYLAGTLRPTPLGVRKEPGFP